MLNQIVFSLPGAKERAAATLESVRHGSVVDKHRATYCHTAVNAQRASIAAHRVVDKPCVFHQMWTAVVQEQRTASALCQMVEAKQRSHDV